MEKNILVSIVTVCYNEENTIKTTIESVLNQEFASYEYIVIDGGSTDNTNNIIHSFDDSFRRKGINYVHISERDGGIYCAMNKALVYCKGLWVNYMNAGDRFFDKEVLKKVFEENEYDSYACIYGNTWNCYANTSYWRSAKKIESITYDHPFVHQAAFVRTDVMKAYGFNDNYKIYADWDVFLRMYFSGEKFAKIDVDIANYDLTGVSQQNSHNARLEKAEIRKKIPFNRRFSIKRIPLSIIHFLCKNDQIRTVYSKVRKALMTKREK